MNNILRKPWCSCKEMIRNDAQQGRGPAPSAPASVRSQSRSCLHRVWGPVKWCVKCRRASQKWPVDWVFTGGLARPLGICAAAPAAPRPRPPKGPRVRGRGAEFKIQISGINSRPGMRPSPSPHFVLPWNSPTKIVDSFGCCACALPG